MPHTFPTRRASVLAQANKATQAQSRIKRLAKLAGTEAVRAERSLHINFQAPARLPFSLLRLNEVDAGYRASAGHEDPDAELPDARASVAGSAAEIGRAACRGRVWHDGENSVVRVEAKKKQRKEH